jgi:hypothetical protein
LEAQFELADIINRFYNEDFRLRIPVHQQRTLHAIQRCRTATLGGHVDSCDSCGHIKISYNSCRNRNCPKCQGLQKEMWAIQREEELLPVAYFHLVFTLPSELNGLALRNPRFIYDLLFEAAWYTIRTFGEDPKCLGARSAATIVLHTWGQQLTLHPHVHCIVPSGGLKKDGTWQRPKKGNAKFLYPILAMNQVFKAYFLRKMSAQLELNALSLPPSFPMNRNYYNWKEKLYAKSWVVYAKPPFGGPKHVVKYLARYSHRIAISNQRILDITDTHVSFRYKDYKNGAKLEVRKLTGHNFLQRFCLHILPHRFRKIRHYGFLANASKRKSLLLARKALSLSNTMALTKAQRKELAISRMFSEQANKCPCCHKGTMIIRELFAPNKEPPSLRRNHTILISQF